MASVPILALAILNDLYWIEASELYHEDPYFYVRPNLVVSRLLGQEQALLHSGTVCPDLRTVGPDPDVSEQVPRLR